MRCLRLLLALGLLPPLARAEAGRLRENFDFGWRFLRGDAAGAEALSYPDGGWRRLDLPHDWSIEGPYDAAAPSGGPGGYLPTGVGWYRKHFEAPAAQAGRRIEIQFDGVYRDSEVWLNGHLLGRWPYGYTTFRYDLTPYLVFGGPNVIAVRVDNSRQPGSRWYSGSGIDRNVWLTASDPLRIAPEGVTVVTRSATADAATLEVRTRVRNGRGEAAEVRVSQRLEGALEEEPAALRLEAGAEAEVTSVLTLPHPRLWSPEHPALYRLRTDIGTDAVETSVGVRAIAYDAERGFLLNGRPVKLLGMCLHQDGGAVGSAVPEAVWERRLRLLQAMGCNAIRTSHNPPDPALLELCDRLGFLVMDEAFDEWTVRKPQIKFGYSAFFPEWHQRDLEAMIRRDRNHPSVVMWSAGNEIGEQWSPRGPAILRELVETFHREDPTRPVTAAMDRVFTDAGRAPAAFTGLLDIVGYNYVDRWLDRRETYFGPDHAAFPERRMVGTEDASAPAVRGEYPERAAPAGTPPRPLYLSAPVRTEQLWKFALTHAYVIGHFMWTGFDYLGESRWPAKASSSGALDTCGFPKDTYYLYQSIFSPRPMLHLLPHWTWPGREGKVVPVLAYTNCEVVELFLNGRSLGAKAREFPRPGTQGGWNTYARPPVFPTTADLHLEWDVPYEAGELKAVGYRGGAVACTETVRTAGVPAALEIVPDRTALRADARDAASLEVRVVDAQGTVVPGASNRVSFSVEGPAVLLGVDNGDPQSHEPYQAGRRDAFHGLCLAVIQTRREAGPIRVTARADGLREAAAELASAPAPEAPALFGALP